MEITDEKLIKQLRLQSEHVPAFTIFDKAADRIEELVRERDDYAYKLIESNNTYTEMHIAIEQLQAKLTKAMNALREIKSVECAHCTDLFNELADAVLDGTEGET
jgi:uncharacterized coiled-coil DUF342 family protein